MAFITCYDPQGVAYQKEPVDAKECVEHCGFSMSKPGPVQDPEPEPTQTKQEKKSRAALMAIDKPATDEDQEK